MNKKCQLSVVLVSDFEPNHSKSWKNERALIQALADQDIAEPFEVILVESEQKRDQTVPAYLYHSIPDLKVHYYDSIKSATLKTYGVSLSSGRYIAVLESDCVPSKNWLRLLLEVIVNKEWVVASGRTYYGEETTYRRIMNLLHRSWDDHGRSCETRHISNNGAVYKRQILEKFPFPDAVTPFQSAQIRNAQIRQEGYRFYFERAVTMRHTIGGWSFIWDLQRNKGHQKMCSYHHHTFSVMPKLLVSKLKQNAQSCRLFGKEYLRWYDFLLLPFFMLAELVPFSVGMVDAINKVQSIPGSAYR